MLLLCWALLLGGAVFLGERPSSFSTLERAVASEEVDRVEVAGDLQRGARGFAVVDVHWRQGAFAYGTQVVEARPRRAARRYASGEERVTAVMTEDVAARLVASRPGLDVVRVQPAGATADLLGRRLPAWMVWPSLVLGVGSLVLLVVGPEPRRATRWAWFWVLGVAPPAGMLAFLLLSGATPLLPPPREPARRLTGGWAFLLSAAVGTVLGQQR